MVTYILTDFPTVTFEASAGGGLITLTFSINGTQVATRAELETLVGMAYADLVFKLLNGSLVVGERVA